MANFTTQILKARKETINLGKSDVAKFKAFSDGSGLNGGIGAATILYPKNRNMPITHLKKFIDSQKKYNTYEAEIVGAILALWSIRNCPETVGKSVSLYIDNQAVISSIGSPDTKPGQYLLRQLNTLANNLACNLGIHWISSHSKVRGNEKVDELVKEATLGKSSATNRLPHILRTLLPTSTSAIKQQF